MQQLKIGDKVKVISCEDSVPPWQKKLLEGYIFRVKEVQETTIETVYKLTDPFGSTFSDQYLNYIEV